MNLFEEKTGNFIPPSDAQIAMLNPDQREAYDNLVIAVGELDATNKEADAARDHTEQCVRNLADAEAAQANKPTYTAFDEWKRSVGQAPPETPQQPDTTVHDAQEALSESHVRLRVADERQRGARGALAAAIQKFQLASGDTQTFEQLARQHIENENRLRAERVAAGRSAASGSSRPGPSAVDQYAFYTRASGRRSGGGRSFARGGVSQTEAMARNNLAAWAARQKLPSVR